MTVISTVTPSEEAGPAIDIYRQVRGLIASGQLGADEKLPTVRQMASDLGVAPGTVAKAYKLLEQDGLVYTRTAAGTRVSPTAAVLPGSIAKRVRQLIDEAKNSDIEPEVVLDAFRMMWKVEVEWRPL